MVEELRKSGYRPIRARPYTHEGSIRVAAAWTRDGRDWQMAVDQSKDEIQRADQIWQTKGFVAVDAFGYLSNRGNQPTERYGLRDQLRAASERELHLKSFTSRDECYAEDPTKSLLLEVEGQAETRLTLHLRSPVEQTVSARLADLRDENIVRFTGGFTSESYIINRLISPSEYSASVMWSDPRPGSPPDWYYVRVTQHNGQLAWSSPIWVG
jgi:hypothetical protein